MPVSGQYVPDTRSYGDGIQHARVRQRLDPLYAVDDDALSIVYYNHWLLGDFIEFQGQAPTNIRDAKALFDELSRALWNRYLVDFDTINRRLAEPYPDDDFRKVDPLTDVLNPKMRHEYAADEVAADPFSFTRNLDDV